MLTKKKQKMPYTRMLALGFALIILMGDVYKRQVDRSAAYAARYVAKNIVAAGLADKCEIQLSYAIGVAQPTSIMVDTYGTGKDVYKRQGQALIRCAYQGLRLSPHGIKRIRLQGKASFPCSLILFIPPGS